jgi:flagellar FliL protein
MERDEDLALLEGPAAQPQMPLLHWLGVMGAVSLLAIAVGGGVGYALVGMVGASLQAPASVGQSAPALPYGAGVEVRELSPIITNLARPSNTWVRLQAAIVFDNKGTQKPDADAAEISADILAFLRTLSLDQIGGASGLGHLREDLNERATIRSEGRVREVVIQTLVVQ